MKLSGLLIAISFLLQHQSIHGQGNLSGIDKKLTELMQTTQAPGVAVVVVKGNKIIYAKGFGYSNLETNEKVDANTLFAIGSTSKAFTTALLGIMEEEKGMSFDDSPRKYIPELQFFNDDLNNKLTITDLVCHRTGIPRHDYSWYLFPTTNRDSMIQRIRYQAPYTGIREHWYYNNFMYLTQGVIVERLTGKTWEDNIRSRFFGPLNMSRSSLTIAEMLTQKNIAKGYGLIDFSRNQPLDYFNIGAISPAGSINSSVSEMANWLMVWINGGQFNGQQILPQSYVKKALNPLMLLGKGIADPKFPAQHLNSYGYAWFVSSYKGHYRLEHGGNIDGFSANVSFFPSDSIGIVVLTNQDGSMLPGMVRNQISDAILGLEKSDWLAYTKEKIGQQLQQAKEAKLTQASERVLNTVPSHGYSNYAGTYNHPGYGTFTISLQNDSLFASFPVKKMYLKHWNYDVFKPYLIENGKIDTNNAVDFQLNFQTNDLGEIASAKLKLEPTLDPMEFKRTALTVKLTNDELAVYNGNYLLDKAKLSVIAKGEGLTLVVPGQPEYKLIAISADEFEIVGLPGYKAKFERVGGGIDALKLIQPNGTFIAKKEK